MNVNRNAALAYAARDLFVFEARFKLSKNGKWGKQGRRSGKKTNGRNWGMTKDPTEIQELWGKYPDDPLGIPTGSANGIFVLDIDTITVDGHKNDGFAALRALEEKYERLPPTLMARSPTGSVHYYFRLPSGMRIKNSASEIVIEGDTRALGIDVRGEGGMVIAPPSKHPRGGRYRWLNDFDIADAPPWLIEIVPKSGDVRQRSGVARPRVPATPKVARILDPVLAAMMRADSGKGASLLPEDNDFPDIERIKLACLAVPNRDLGWDDWNTVAMAIWHATGGNAEGLTILHAWSRKSTKYDAAETDDRWATISRCPPTKFNGTAKLVVLAKLADPEWERCNPHLKIWAALARLPFDENHQFAVGSAVRAGLGDAGSDLFADWGGSGWEQCVDGPGHCGDNIYRLADKHDPTWWHLYRRMLDAEVQS
ncbi:hypothetical protein ACVWXP_001716 [Bradyrhizobium sp. USDA 4463]